MHVNVYISKGFGPYYGKARRGQFLKRIRAAVKREKNDDEKGHFDAFL